MYNHNNYATLYTNKSSAHRVMYPFKMYYEAFITTIVKIMQNKIFLEAPVNTMMAYLALFHSPSTVFTQQKDAVVEQETVLGLPTTFLEETRMNMFGMAYAIEY